MPKLFSKFVTNSSGGTGIGLFISKSIVEAHGGRIWAENNANGKGATFTFSLPVFLSPVDATAIEAVNQTGKNVIGVQGDVV